MRYPLDMVGVIIFCVVAFYEANVHDIMVYLSICIFVWALIKFDYFIRVEQYVSNCMRLENTIEKMEGKKVNF